MILDEIIANKRRKIAALKEHFNSKALCLMTRNLPSTRDFQAAFKKGRFNLIAEIKKASPSAGLIKQDFDPRALAEAYQESGAAAISVLTEEKYFQGRLDYLKAVKDITTVPILCKDFIIDEMQICEARLSGADAILLIARILSDDELSKLLKIAQEMKLQALVETHNAEEVGRALKSGARVIGINNRDLDTLEIDLKTTVDLMKKFPELKKRVVISESGVKTRQDVELLKKAGVNGALIGETLMKSDNIPAKIEELFGK